MRDRCKTAFFAIVLLSLVFVVILLSNLPDYSDSRQGWPLWAQPNNPPLPGGPQALHDNYISLDPTHGSSSNTNVHGSRYKQFNPPEQPNFMKYLLGPPKRLNKLETLFYQFDSSPHQLSSAHGALGASHLDSISSEKHALVTSQLANLEGLQDKFVRNEGFHLFAFNMLISNRIGLIRPIPDTRNQKCHAVLSPQQPITIQDTTVTPIVSASKYLDLDVTASIIICFYNEAPSALLRTIYTIIERSPRHLIKEIILVDDFSDQAYDIQHITQANLPDYPIRHLRTSKREGLIRARLLGSRSASGDILVFLDSHVEANKGWLEPLLEVVNHNRTTIACPIIDLINADTLIYSGSPMVVGGLSWNLNFKWDSVPSDKLRTYDDFVKPIDSPTMAGGLYAINREYFTELGEYDDQMELWGGENIEMSLRTWMCGGRIVVVPCSRVGHIFRKRRPYGPDPGKPDSLLVNSQRTARVWLDEYISNYYEANPNAQYLVGSSVDSRRQLRQNLGCQNFTWFLENVYPELIKSDSSESGYHHSAETETDDASTRGHKPANLFSTKPRRVDRDINEAIAADINRSARLFGKIVPGNVAAVKPVLGRIRGQSNKLPKIVSWLQIRPIRGNNNLCVGIRGHFSWRELHRLFLVDCEQVYRNEHGEILLPQNGSLSNQLWAETETHQLRLAGQRCLDLMKNMPLLGKCHLMGSFQRWKRVQPDLTDNQHRTDMDSSLLINIDNGLCLGVERLARGEPLIITLCENSNQLDSSNKNHAARRLASSHGWLASSGGSWQTAPLSALSAPEVRLRTRGALMPIQRWSILALGSQLTKTADRTASLTN